MKDDEILFVLGAARSGTTYVSALLETWFGFGMGPEGRFVPRLARRYAPPGRERTELTGPALARMVRDILAADTFAIPRTVYPPDKRFDITPEAVMARARSGSYADVVHAAFACMADAQDCTRVGNKNPDYWRHLPVLERVFGRRARYLSVVRDGRDVARSLLRMPWGPHSVHACARIWAESLASVQRFAPAAGARLCQLRYEDLLARPQHSVAQLEAFLDLDLDPAARAALLTSIRDNPLRENTGRWQCSFTGSDARIFEAVAGNWLEELGYANSIESPRLRPGEALRFTVQEDCRRAMFTVKSIVRAVRTGR